jgi:general secretion pathway protein H
MIRPRQSGFTLIEIMVVATIIALVMAGVSLSVGSTARVKLRSSCVLVMSAVRYGFSRAVTQGTTVRLVLDFDTKSMHLEEASGRVVLNLADETGEGLKRSEDEEAERQKIEEDRKSFLNLSGASSSGGSSSSGGPPKPGDLSGGLGGLGSVLGGGVGGGLNASGDNSSNGEGFVMDEAFYSSLQQMYAGNPMGYQPPAFKLLPGKRGKDRKLEGDTIFKKVFTPHETAPREEGKAFLYFFPNGLGEHAFIQLSDGDSSEERIYTIETHPLSGKSFLFSEELEPEGELDELEDAEE